MRSSFALVVVIVVLLFFSGVLFEKGELLGSAISAIVASFALGELAP